MRGLASGRFSRRGRDSHDMSNDPPNGPPRSRHCSEGLDERFSQGSVSSGSMGDAVSSPCQMHTSSEFIGTFIAQGRSAAIQQNSHGRNALNSAPPRFTSNRSPILDLTKASYQQSVLSAHQSSAVYLFDLVDDQPSPKYPSFEPSTPDIALRLLDSHSRICLASASRTIRLILISAVFCLNTF